MNKPLPDKGRRMLIAGLGKTGLSCARYLASHGFDIAVTDSREHPPGLAVLREELPDAAVFLGGFSEAALRRADELVVSPGIPLDNDFVRKARDLGLAVVGDIELFAQAVTAPVVAVTGSNGKSTVTSMVGHMAEAAGQRVRVGANLGVPALDLLDDPATELFVLELSSFQLELVESLDLVAAAVLNVSADHLDRYPDVAHYAGAKARIFRHAGVAVVNREDPEVMAMPRAGQTVVSFGLDQPAGRNYGVRELEGELWIARGGEQLMEASELRVRGRHNLANALAALALGEAAGLAQDTMLDALRSFSSLPHRMEWVAETDGIAWYNDSKATNIGATLAAVGGLPGPLILIAGGDGKGQDFTPLAAALQNKARLVVLLGRDADSIAQVLEPLVPVLRAADMEAAVTAAAAQAKPGDLVLLSPACSSLDMFENFEARGRAFADAVRSLAHA